jgi:hypothetical protein
MKQRRIGALLLSTSVLGLLTVGCPPGGVGDPCTPEDEYRPRFSNFGVDEVNIESRSFQCLTRICLVNHFQGRVSCPYGQNLEGEEVTPEQDRCRVPGTNELIQVAVAEQLKERQASKAVYCSCRCDGPDDNARYCKCPDGYSCERLVEDLGLGVSQLSGSYCVRSGTAYDELNKPASIPCSLAAKDCGEEVHPQ